MAADGLRKLDKKAQKAYESFWLYSESHPWRLAQHITLRGVFAGATLGLIGSVPYSLIRRKGPLGAVIGRAALRGAAGGGFLLGLVATERWYHLPAEGVTDRAYRLSYNWGQNRWDILAADGALLGLAFFRRPFGGALAAGAVGIGLGTLAYIGTTAAIKMA